MKKDILLLALAGLGIGYGALKLADPPAVSASFCCVSTFECIGQQICFCDETACIKKGGCHCTIP